MRYRLCGCPCGGFLVNDVKSRHLLSTLCLTVAVMFLLSVSVHPAMAAEAINGHLGNCANCGAGMDGLSPIPGLEGKKIPTVNILGKFPTGFRLRPPVPVCRLPATVAGTQKRHVNAAITLDIRDPLAAGPAFATALSEFSGTGADDPVRGRSCGEHEQRRYDLTAESSHRYESTVTSDDLLSLNSSQKAALVTEGFTLTASDTVRCTGRPHTIRSPTGQRSHGLSRWQFSGWMPTGTRWGNAACA